jgi:hypothetical protein
VCGRQRIGLDGRLVHSGHGLAVIAQRSQAFEFGLVGGLNRFRISNLKLVLLPQPR